MVAHSYSACSQGIWLLFQLSLPPPLAPNVLAINCRFYMGVVVNVREWFHSQFYFRVVVTSRRSPATKCTLTQHVCLFFSGEPPPARRGSRIKAHLLLVLFIQWAWFIMLPCTAGEHRVLVAVTLMCQWGKVDDITRSLIFIRFLFSVVPCNNSSCSRCGHDVKENCSWYFSFILLLSARLIRNLGYRDRSTKPARFDLFLPILCLLILIRSNTTFVYYRNFYHAVDGEMWQLYGNGRRVSRVPLSTEESVVDLGTYLRWGILINNCCMPVKTH